MGDTTYPTDELSHPEYVNDDFRMFTFKVWENSLAVWYPFISSLVDYLIVASGNASRASLHLLMTTWPFTERLLC